METGSTGECRPKEEAKNASAAKNQRVQSGRSGNKQTIFQVATPSKSSALGSNVKMKGSTTMKDYMSPAGDNRDYTGYSQKKSAGKTKGTAHKAPAALPPAAISHTMKMQLYQSLQTHDLNYLTAAYYLTQKHEFS